MHKNPYGSHGCHATSFYATSETLFKKSDYLKRRVKKETLFEPIRNELSPFFFIYLLLSTGLDDKRKIQNEYVQMIYTQIS